MKLGSLFDGSGTAPLCAAMLGWEPVWAAEVEPYPIAVTKSRFPNMKHLGDISKINGAEIEPVDIITFGSPCQDLSVAGKRAGLKHTANGDEETTRSGLFMEAVRIIKEMREATNGEFPSFALWENVPGAFSSQKGEDFRVVLEELIKIVEPQASMPPVPKAGWSYADSFVGDGWSIAYRVFDAQYWGVPQRRRRIFLVLDLRGQRAREVLFEREGLRGYLAQSRTPWQGIAADAQDGPGAADRETNGAANRVDAVVYGIDHAITTEGDCTAQGSCVYEGIQATLKASGPHAVAYTLEIRSGCECGGKGALVQKKPKPRQYLFENHSQDTRYKGPMDTCPMLLAQLGTGGNNTPFVDEEQALPTAYCIGNGQVDQLGIDEICSTLNCMHDQIAVLVKNESYQTSVGALCVRDCKGVGSQYVSGDKCVVQCDRSKPMSVYYIVRRLTPTECARLQGFPDRWGDIELKESFTDEEHRFWQDVRNTHAAINSKAVKDYTEAQMLTWYNKLHTDGAEYKMWGNGMALPCLLYVLSEMEEGC